MSIGQRRAAILARLDKLQATAPEDWSQWSFQQSKDFSADVQQLKRLANSNGALHHVLRIGERVAKAYGKTMAEIDPCHGSDV